MRKQPAWSVITFSLLALTTLARAEPGSTQPAVLSVGGEGGWDYALFESSDKLLYVTRREQVQIVDPASGRLVATVELGGALHGTAVVPAMHRAFVTDGKNGTIDVFDTKSHAVLGRIPAADDADGVIYDAKSDRILVSCGDAQKLLILDPHSEIGRAKCEAVDLGAKPEFLAADDKGKAYVCLNDRNEIAVVDIAERKLVTKWPTTGGTEPTGLAIDAAHGKLFVGCRNQKMVVMETASGEVVSVIPIGKGNDACAFDPGAGAAFASCGDGTVAEVREAASGKFESVRQISTAPGSRTMAIDPETHTLYLPAADFEPLKPGQRRPTMKTGTFRILVISTSH